LTVACRIEAACEADEGIALISLAVVGFGSLDTVNTLRYADRISRGRRIFIGV
jgi:hypothetical protein